MANQWFKFYGGEYLSDPKIDRLSPLERSCWVTLLCLASMNGDGQIEFLTVETLLNKSGIQFDPYHPEEWEGALAVLKKFQNMKMIESDEGGNIFIKNWEKRQEHNLTVAERVAKSRANNPERAKELGIIQGLKKHGLTVLEWEDIKSQYNFCCAMCGTSSEEKLLTVDHIIPPSKGGIRHKDNIQPLCKSCNSSKKNKIFKVSSEHVTNPSERVTSEENRIEENRREEGGRTPSEIAKDFFGLKDETPLQPYKDRVPEQILRSEAQKFILYWTEPNKSGTRKRWELERTFDVHRRLATWFSRVRNYQQNTKSRTII